MLQVSKFITDFNPQFCRRIFCIYHHGGVFDVEGDGEAGRTLSDIDGGTNGTGMSVRNGVMPEVEHEFLSLPAVHAASAVLFQRLPSFLFGGEGGHARSLRLVNDSSGIGCDTA